MDELGCFELRNHFVSDRCDLLYSHADEAGFIPHLDAFSVQELILGGDGRVKTSNDIVQPWTSFRVTVMEIDVS